MFNKLMEMKLPVGWVSMAEAVKALVTHYYLVFLASMGDVMYMQNRENAGGLQLCNFSFSFVISCVLSWRVNSWISLFYNEF
jgi:hypothetical protein